MMDPVSATGLAAAIIQLADYTRKVLSTTQELYRSADGALLRHEELASVTGLFRDSLDKLISHEHYEEVKNQLPVTPELSKVVREAKAVTEDLVSLLDHLKGKASQGKRWKSIRQAILTIRKASELSDLEQRINRYADKVQLALVLDLRLHVSQIQNAQVQSAEKVKGYFEILSEAINAEGRDRDQSNRAAQFHQPLVSVANKHLRNEHELPQELTSQMLCAMSDADREARKNAIREQIKELLTFDEIHSRHDAIPEAYRQTFQWIFCKPQRHNASSDWADFGAWLNGRDSMYWIAGKPGAGKSTLMKYLFAHPTTDKLTKTWPKHDSTASDSVSKAGFFFWSPGSSLQRSSEGLVRSLILQLWSSTTNAIEVFPVRVTRCDILGRMDEPFTWEELTDALDAVLSDPTRRFLLFIDGLDEFEGDKYVLADYVLRLSAKPNVKICTASRPWVEFQTKFASAPQLLIERLTHRDIITYIDGQFGSSPEYQDLQSAYPELAKKIRDSIISKCAGVFLWVYVVVANLLLSLVEGIPLEELVHRLDNLSPELNDLFDKIFAQLKEANAQEASELIQYVDRYGETTALIDLYGSRLALIDIVNADMKILTKQEADYLARSMRRNLFSRCKCLLYVDKDVTSTTKVHWLHRTARDYLKSPEVWPRIRNMSPNYRPEQALAKSLLRRLKQRVDPDDFITKDFGAVLFDALWLTSSFETPSHRVIFVKDLERVAITMLGTAESTCGFAYCFRFQDSTSDIYKLMLPFTTAFHVAVAQRNVKLVQDLAEPDPDIIRSPISKGNDIDALMLAGVNGDWNMQVCLLRLGADPNKRSPRSHLKAIDQKTAWQMAIERLGELQGKKIPARELMEACTEFLRRGADPNIMREQPKAQIILRAIVSAETNSNDKDDVRLLKDCLLFKKSRVKAYPKWLLR